MSPLRANSSGNPLDQVLAKRSQNPKQPPTVAAKPSQEVYEFIEEPTNEAEVNLDMNEPSLMPYAIHEFPDESTELRSSSVTTKPKPPSKSNISRHKKGSKDPAIRRSLSESGRDDPHRIILPGKPPVSKRGHIPMKPPLKGSSSTPPVPDAMAYSELDKKTSYATLEPHMGEKREDISTLLESNTKDSYCHLNH